MAEEKFEFLPPTEEELRNLETRANTKVDSRVMAEQMVADRDARPASWIAAFEARFGIDPRRTLTELEEIDAGDGFAIHDEPEVHALRRVPLARWTAGDVQLMLTYRQGLQHAIWLAVPILESAPMIEAVHYAGDLLLMSAKVVATTDLTAAPSGETARIAIQSAADGAERSIWNAFDEQGRALKTSDADREAARQRLVEGHPFDAYDPFWETERSLNTLAEARDALSPATILGEAEAEMVYAVYRPRRGLELVPAYDLADPGVIASLDHPDTFYFRRETRFEIVAHGERVRLRHFSPSAIENWHGIGFAEEGEAIAFAQHRFGIAPTAWRIAG
jgi:hypothetical protein